MQRHWLQLQYCLKTGTVTESGLTWTWSMLLYDGHDIIPQIIRTVTTTVLHTMVVLKQVSVSLLYDLQSDCWPTLIGRGSEFCTLANASHRIGESAGWMLFFHERSKWGEKVRGLSQGVQHAACISIGQKIPIDVSGLVLQLCSL